MTSVAARITADQFLELDDNGLELLDGEISEIAMSANSSGTEADLIAELGTFVRERRLGKVFSSTLGYRIWPDRPDHVRKPDVTFIAQSRLPGDLPNGHFRIVPDLAVEVVSPGDSADYINAKIRDYAEAGVRLTWIIFPDGREARIYRGAQETAVIDDNGSLDGEDVIPGLSIPLASVLPARR